MGGSELTPITRRCGGRCWFAVGVSTGIQAPTCERCGHPNPRWNEAKQAAYDEYMRPPDRFEWLRCYDIVGDVEDDGWAFCPTHDRRYSYMLRGDRGPWHLYLVNYDNATSEDEVQPPNAADQSDTLGALRGGCGGAQP